MLSVRTAIRLNFFKYTFVLKAVRLRQATLRTKKQNRLTLYCSYVKPPFQSRQSVLFLFHYQHFCRPLIHVRFSVLYRVPAGNISRKAVFWILIMYKILLDLAHWITLVLLFSVFPTNFHCKQNCNVKCGVIYFTIAASDVKTMFPFF